MSEEIAGVRKLIRGRGRERGCGQGDGGRDGVAYNSEAMNSNACGMLVQGLGTRRFQNFNDTCTVYSLRDNRTDNNL